jgi:hypothetical protein
MANVDIANHVPRSSPVAGQKQNPLFNILAGVVIVSGIVYAGYHLADDLSVVRDARVYPYILLGIALVIALGFEFVNGFHDTANAVATVIYTNSLSPWSAKDCAFSASPRRWLFRRMTRKCLGATRNNWTTPPSSSRLG